MSKDASSWEKSLGKIRKTLEGHGPESAATLEELDKRRVHILGRRGILTELLKALKDLSIEDRRRLGPEAQSLKSELDAKFDARRAELEAASDEARGRDAVDLTLPPVLPQRGRLHPLTLVMDEMTRILVQMGFSMAEGPLVESEYYNFEALNIPAHHPARDMQDTFYLAGPLRTPLLMRTHTSPVQIRSMESSRPPLRLISPGRVFRHDEVDASHSAVFHQVEGLAVDKNVSFADLKGTLQTFIQSLLGPAVKMRLRPSYFPFTEPSAEVDVSCLFCAGSGCGVCKRSGWLEMLGAGMVHSNVLKGVGYDPARWSGFAFGIGVERVAMLKLGVGDIRHFYENDQRFLRQFDENIV